MCFAYCFTELTRKNFIYDRFMDWSKPETLHGGNSTLDWDQGDNNPTRLSVSSYSALWSYWISLPSRTAWWCPPRKCFLSYPRTPGDNIKGLSFDWCIVFLSYYEHIQIGWITLDNASNNDTFLSKFKEKLISCGIAFDNIKQCIRYANTHIWHQVYSLVVW